MVWGFVGARSWHADDDSIQNRPLLNRQKIETIEKKGAAGVVHLDQLSLAFLIS